jgi:hypothetical protein
MIAVLAFTDIDKNQDYTGFRPPLLVLYNVT